MTTLDWLVFFVFLAYVVWDGVRRARTTRNLEGYFAGDRQIAWWAAGLSIMATQASAITVIGTTGQGHEHGMEFVQMYFGLAFAMVILSIFIVPIYRRQPILTAYEFLEGRFGPGTRTLASVIFLVSRCLAFGAVLYAPAVVLAAMLDLSDTLTVVIIGALTTIYTLVGGVKAVIATDVKQMLVIICGLFLCCGILLSKVMQHVDFGGVLSVLGAAGKLNAVELEPAATAMVPNLAWAADDAPKSFWQEKYNFWSGTIGGLFLMLAYFGADQSQVQRILSSRSAKESRMALLMSAFAKVPMQALVLFIGVLLYLFFVLDPGPMLFNPKQQEQARTPEIAAQIEGLQADYDVAVQKRRQQAMELAKAPGHAREHPELVQQFRATAAEVNQLRKRARQAVSGETAKDDTNYIFPHFILNNVPIILLGLMIAAIFAAAMSSADSALNALTSSTVVDLHRRLINPDATEKQALRASRWTTLFWGVSATAAALLFRGQGSVIEMINRVGSYFYGSLFGVFLLALVCPGAGKRAGFFGLLGGMATVLLVDRTLQVEFLWYNVIGVIGVLAVGFPLSLIDRGRRTG